LVNTVGWLIGESDEFLLMVLSIVPSADDDESYSNCRIKIPKAWIISITILTKKKS